MPFEPTALRLEPIYQYRLWGGRKLEGLLPEPLPEGPIGEAWILSDRDDFPSVVADGPHAGRTLPELISSFPSEMLGKFAEQLRRYPLLLKLLDAREMLSVQVHPSDQHQDLLPPGERGKTEAWVVLQSDPTSSILAGLQPGTTPDDLRHLTSETSGKFLASFNPSVGDTVFLEAGTVHALGGGVLVFEVQQNSDVTFRMFDWDRVDEKTGKSRELHIEQALRCIDYGKGPLGASVPVAEPDGRERLVACEFFRLWRRSVTEPVLVSAEGEPRVVYVLSGRGRLVSAGESVHANGGNVFFLPPALGEVHFEPDEASVIFEVAIG